MKTKLNFQNNEMQKILDTLLFGNIFSFILSWFCINGLFGEKEQNFWITGMILTSAGLLFFLILTLLKDKLISPVKFHCVVFLLSLFNGLLLFDAALKLTIYSGNLQGQNAFLLFVINVLIIIGGLVSQTFAFREGLKNATNQNIKSGRLNIPDGLWDLAAPIHFNTKESESEKLKSYKRIARLSPVVTAITFIIARAVEGNAQSIIVGVVIFIMSVIYIWGYTKHLAIAIQIREWEKEYKTKISLRAKALVNP
jgi:hypothetical protein